MKVAALSFALVAALQGAVNAQTDQCEVCHLRNDHTLDVALPLSELEGTQCAKYSGNSCCSADTSNKIGTGLLYGQDYKIDRCYDIHPTLTRPANAAKCLRWFAQEECLYECDVNAGKFRKHATCVDETGDDNGWQIERMPLKASECDQMYEDCKDFHMCTCSGVQCGPDNGAEASLFAVGFEECSDLKFCRAPLSERVLNGQQFCEKVWDGAFVYDTNEANAYSIAWNDAILAPNAPTVVGNPNNAIKSDVPFPANCPELEATNADCQTLQAGAAVPPVVAEATPTPAAATPAAAPVSGAAGVSQLAAAAVSAAAAWMLL